MTERGSRSSTVSRGLSVLWLLSERPEGLTITELSRALETPRPPLTRVVNSLVDHRTVHRRANGRYVLGAGLLELARPLQRSLDATVRIPLQRAADAAGAGAVLVVDGGEGPIAAASASPQTSELHLVTPVGHRFTAGPIAPRVAIDMQRDAVGGTDADRAAVDRARDAGYAMSRGLALAGTTAVAYPVLVPEEYGLGCVMLVTTRLDADAELVRVGAELAAELGERFAHPL